MELATEVRLLGDLKALANQKRRFVPDDVATNSIEKYSCQSHFERELNEVLRQQPRIIGHSSELPADNSFLRRESLGIPLLITRDDAGQVHAFLNVCRHRGTRLVDDEVGCKDRLMCPYHAWSWSTRGELLNIPFGEDGFPHADPKQLGLIALPCAERHGWIFIAGRDQTLDLDAYLEGLEDDLRWLAADKLEVKGVQSSERNANWKLLIEGGLEAYHFRIVHRHTIGPHFPNNLSSYQRFGDNLRSILPRASINQVDLDKVETSLIRDQANVLYTLFPMSQLLVMPDHIVWTFIDPLGPDSTRTSIVMLGEPGYGDEAHWQRNLAITTATLNEDAEIAESIQSVIHAGANDAFTFGRFEGALAAFNQSLDRCIG